jgi:hypothetical protein
LKGHGFIRAAEADSFISSRASARDHLARRIFPQPFQPCRKKPQKSMCGFSRREKNLIAACGICL